MMSGNQKQGSTRMYPDESLQAFIEPDPWWEDAGRDFLLEA